MLDVEVEAGEHEGLSAATGGCGGVVCACDCAFRAELFPASRACGLSRGRSLRCNCCGVELVLSDGDFASSLLWLLPISLAICSRAQRKSAVPTKTIHGGSMLDRRGSHEAMESKEGD